MLVYSSNLCVNKDKYDNISRVSTGKPCPHKEELFKRGQKKVDSFIALLNVSGLLFKKQKHFIYYLFRNDQGLSENSSAYAHSHNLGNVKDSLSQFYFLY